MSRSKTATLTNITNLLDVSTPASLEAQIVRLCELGAPQGIIDSTITSRVELLETLPRLYTLVESLKGHQSIASIMAAGTAAGFEWSLLNSVVARTVREV